MTDLLAELYSPGYARYGPGTNGGATTAPARRADPRKEYVAAGSAYGTPGTPRLLPPAVDEIVALHGPRIYLAMNRDPACRAAVMALKLGIVAGGMDLAPAEKPKAGAKSLTPDEQTSKDMVDYVWRQVERCPAFEATTFDLLEACVAGVRLAEFTLEPEADGPDVGKLGLARLCTKPNDRWRFVVDPYNDVQGIEVRSPAGAAAEAAVYPPEKFVWLSWDPCDGDPRGTSVYAAAFETWNLKLRTWPQLYRYLVQFGSPSLLGTTAPGEADRAALDPVSGHPTGEVVNAQEFMAGQLVAFQNGSVMVVPAGATVAPIQPAGNGEAFHRAIDLYDRQITHAILGTTSATMEAQHDSRAKGEVGQDVVGLKVERGRKALAECLRGLFRRLIALNFGEDAARLTPLVTFGQSDQQDRPALWGAAGGLKSSGYLGESQVAELDQMIGLPIRDLEADEAKAKAKQDEAMAQQQAMTGPPPGDGGGDGPPSSSGEGGPKSSGPPKAKGKPAGFK